MKIGAEVAGPPVRTGGFAGIRRKPINLDGKMEIRHDGDFSTDYTDVSDYTD